MVLLRCGFERYSADSSSLISHTFSRAISNPNPVVILIEEINRIANTREIQRGIAVMIHNLKRCPGGVRGQGVFVVATCDTVLGLHPDLTDQIDKAYHIPVLAEMQAYELAVRLWPDPPLPNSVDFEDRIRSNIYGWTFKDVKDFVRDYLEVQNSGPFDLAVGDFPLYLRGNPRLDELFRNAMNSWRALAQQKHNNDQLLMWSNSLFRRRAHRDWVERHAWKHAPVTVQYWPHPFGGQMYWPYHPIHFGWQVRP
jgi:hypothetical protein